MLAEPAVTLTDYGLAVLCMVCAALLAGQTPSRVRRPLIGFLLALAAAAVLGGSVHGFFHDESTRVYAILWRATLVSIGLAGFAAWVLAARLIVPAATRPAVIAAGALAGLALCVVIVFVKDTFAVVIAWYLPAAVLLCAAFIVRWRRSAEAAYAVGAAAMLLTFVAAAIQHFRIAPHPQYFDHNALYHAVQAVALIMLYRFGRSRVASEIV